MKNTLRVLVLFGLLVVGIGAYAEWTGEKFQCNDGVCTISENGLGVIMTQFYKDASAEGRREAVQACRNHT